MEPCKEANTQIRNQQEYPKVELPCGHEIGLGSVIFILTPNWLSRRERERGVDDIVTKSGTRT